MDLSAQRCQFSTAVLPYWYDIKTTSFTQHRAPTHPKAKPLTPTHPIIYQYLHYFVLKGDSIQRMLI